MATDLRERDIEKWMSLSLRVALLGFLWLISYPIFLHHHIWDPDIWWHLRAAQLMVAQGHMPWADSFSFTSTGHSWVDHSWLAELITFVFYRSGGWKGVSILTSLLLTSTLWFLWHALRVRGCSALASLAVLAALAGVLSHGANERPQLWTYLGIAAILWITGTQRDRFYPSLLALPVLMAIWSNLHGGCVLGAVIIAGEWIQRRIDASRLRRSVLSTYEDVIFGASILAILANPYGWGVVWTAVEHMRDPLAHQFIAEWRPPDFSQAHSLSLGGILIVLVATLAARKSALCLRDLSLVVLLTYLALSSRRHIHLFVLYCAPIIALELTQMEGQIVHYFGQQRQVLQYIRLLIEPVGRIGKLLVTHLPLLQRAVVVCVAFLAVTITTSAPANGVLDQSLVPVGAVNALEQTHRPGRVLNYYTWGGYLIERGYPDYPVFLDGRFPAVHTDDVVNDYLSMAFTKPGWQEEFDRYGIQYVLWPARTNSNLVPALMGTGQWTVVYRDGLAVLLERRD